MINVIFFLTGLIFTMIFLQKLWSILIKTSLPKIEYLYYLELSRSKSSQIFSNDAFMRMHIVFIINFGNAHGFLFPCCMESGEWEWMMIMPLVVVITLASISRSSFSIINHFPCVEQDRRHLRQTLGDKIQGSRISSFKEEMMDKTASY